MSKPARTVSPIHFDDFDGHQFERLVFAYHLRSEKWRSLEWYGQSGGDGGRDIWGEREVGGSLCIECANRQTLVSTKIVRDLDSLIGAKRGVPNAFRVVCTSTVSAKLRDKIKGHARSCGMAHCDIWSGPEFEERLRHGGEALLKRFIEGVVFPDDPAELGQFAEMQFFSDSDVLESIVRLFDRPAFRTSFQQESSLPAFRQAIGDTIQALNTGIWQTRDGKEIERLPPRHRLSSPKLREELDGLVSDLVQLRAWFEELIRERKIQPCNCAVPDCPVFFLSLDAIQVMDTLRSKLIARVHGLHNHAVTARSTPAQSLSVVGSTNSGIIANQVTIRSGTRSRAIILPGSIGADPARYNYIEYLIKRLTQFREAGGSYGQSRRGRVHPGSTRKILEKQLGGLPKDLHVDRFTEVVAFLQSKIDNTALGRNNRVRKVPSYHSFEDHGAL